MRYKRTLWRKPIVALLLCCTMILSFGGCAPKDSSAEETSTTVTDANDAITQFDEGSEDFGYEDTLSSEKAEYLPTTLEPNTNGNTSSSFVDILMSIQDSIHYETYSETDKEYCRGGLFEIDGKKSLVLMYYAGNGSELSPGYYVGLWRENTNGTISCVTDQLFVEADDYDHAYVRAAILEIEGEMYLNPSVRANKDNIDIWKNQYYLIGDQSVLKYDLYTEAPYTSMGDGLIQHDESKSVFYLNQEQTDRSAFYSLQDELNSSTSFYLGLDPYWSEGQPPEGYTFEELLEQLSMDTATDDSGSENTLLAELGLSPNSIQSIADIYIPFCQSLSDTYTSSDGSVAEHKSCLAVEFESGLPNLVVHYWASDAYSPGQFCEAWIIYGIKDGEVVEIYRDENYAPTRRDIKMVYNENHGFALREEQTGGYYEIIIHYPENVANAWEYENCSYVQLSEDSYTLRVWVESGEYVDLDY